jgi:hypothetical protein
MAKSSTERADPLAAVGLQKKAPGGTTEQREQEPDLKAETLAGRERKSEEERATEKVTAYFTPPQYDHIEELRRQYRKHTKRRISVNALLRRLVERANIEDILP